jgi:hypothetical protein
LVSLENCEGNERVCANTQSAGRSTWCWNVTADKTSVTKAKLEPDYQDIDGS